MYMFKEDEGPKDHATILYERKNKHGHQHHRKPYRLTPYIVTFSEGTLTNIDIQTFLETGLRVVRFNISHIAGTNKLLLLSELKKAINWCCEKHEKSNWPVAISIDMPNAAILTGYIKDEIRTSNVYIPKNSIVEVTSDVRYWNRCDEKRIFIDDAYTLATIKVNTEFNINFGDITMICVEVINNKCIKCRVDEGGYLENAQFVCIRGVKYVKPALLKLDKSLLDFAKENELDIITIHSIRKPKTAERIRNYFIQSPHSPLIMCTICEQEGLDNIDEIIKASDGIILAREFLSCSILNPQRMTAIQLYISAKCRQLGKAFFISGHILQNTLKDGSVTCSELSDVVNALLQGAGFVLRKYTSAGNIVHTMQLLNELCRIHEPISVKDTFWNMYNETQPPVNAADGAIYACAIIAQQTGADAIIILTVTGRSAVKLAHLTPRAPIFSVSVNPTVAKQLQIFRGIIPIVYDRKVKEEDWYDDQNDRVTFAIQYAMENELLFEQQTYVVLRKATPDSAFCDQVSAWTVLNERARKHGIRCSDNTNDSVIPHFILPTAL